MRMRDVRLWRSVVLWTAFTAAAATFIGVHAAHADQPVGAPNKCGYRGDSAGGAAAHDRRPLKPTDDDSPPPARASYQPTPKHTEHRMRAADQRNLARLLQEHVTQELEARHLTLETLMGSPSPSKAH